MMFATPTAPTSSATAPSPRNRPLKAPWASARAVSVAEGWLTLTSLGASGSAVAASTDWTAGDLAVLGAQVDGVGVPVEVQVAFRGLEADEHRAFDSGREHRWAEDPDEVEPLVRGPDPLAGVDVVDPESLRGGGAEHRDRLLRGGGVQVAALHDLDAERVQQAEARRLDFEGVGFDGGDQRRAVHLPFDLPGLRDGFDGVDAGDHRGRHERQLRGLAGEALAVGDGQEVRPEPVDLFEQPCLARGGQAEHGDDRGDPDRDPQRRERRTHPPRAQPHARDAREIGGPQPPRGEVRGAGDALEWGRRRRSPRPHRDWPGASFTSANAADLAGLALALTM